MNENPRFTVIEGGLSNKNTAQKTLYGNFTTFSFAEATRSRLMGVIGIHISYTEPSDSSKKLHHFFYLDYEEYGIDNYEMLLTENSDEAHRKKISLFGGLGEPWVELTETEALYLIEDAYNFTLNKGLTLPKEFENPNALKFTNYRPGLNEIYKLYSKICTPISSENELINYFIMRLAGKDIPMASYLSESCVDFSEFPVQGASALCSNTIDEDENNEGGYICESLIDEDDAYYIIISKVTTAKNKTNHKIASYEPISKTRISNKEASLIMNKDHFIIINILARNSEEDRASVKKWLKSRFDTMTLSNYDNTSIIMVFNSNNAHVNQKRYRIDNDLLGMMFYTQAGELVIDAVSPIKAAVIGQALIEGPVELESAGALKFTDSIMIPFIDSGFESFIEYVQAIQK